MTTSIRLLRAGWNLPHWDPKAEDVLFVCKAAAEELADEHSPVSAGVGGQACDRMGLPSGCHGAGALCMAKRVEQEMLPALGHSGSSWKAR